MYFITAVYVAKWECKQKIKGVEFPDLRSEEISVVSQKYYSEIYYNIYVISLNNNFS